MTESDAEPFTLPDSIVDDPFVRAKDLSGPIDEIAFRRDFRVCVFLNKVRIIAVCDKTDLLGVRLPPRSSGLPLWNTFRAA